ncbi:MAG: type VI secretion system tip protein TssI/VgrG [Rubrivivax sp.]
MELVTSPDVGLKFKSMSTQEEISRLFEFQVLAIAEDPAIAPDDLLGKTAAISIESAEDSKRWFHGVITAFGIDGVEGRFFRYRLTLRPWAWLMTRSSDIRIFQEMTAPDIIKQVFGEYTSTFVDELSGSYATRTYCVQYRETDFNFVSRLMEEEGIFYYFRHAEDKHDLVLADASSTHVATAGFAEILYLEDDKSLAEAQAINTWHMRHEIQTGKYTVSDYNFETPSTSLKSTTAAGTRSHGENGHEVYDYPGLYPVKGDGDARAQIRLDEHSARFGRFTGEGNTPGLATGALFTLTNHPRDDQNADYVLLSTQIDMQQAGYESGGNQDTLFLCRFAAKAAADPFRPPRITRKPTVGGPQTALVVGGADAGDIETDEFGRIKVQFHWDRLGEKNAESSCWLRVAAPFAGNGWGMIALPRIGQEVVVSFLEGDPDQPLVTGSVYNAEQKVPYELPANATVSTVKSRSKLGAAAEFNELRFEDKAGSEYMLLHAQKDRLEFVENTLKSHIGIGDGEGDEHRTVKKDRKEKIEGELHQHVLKDVKLKYDKTFNMKVTEHMSFETADGWSLKTTKDVAIESGATVSIKTTDDVHVKSGANIGAEAAQNVYIKGGTNVVVEGGTEITLKAGGSFVVIGPSGVAIKGAMVMINSGGAAGSGTAPSPVAPTAPLEPIDPDLPEDPLDSGHR